MTIYEALAHATFELLSAATNVRDAFLSHDETGLRVAVIDFWQTMLASEIRRHGGKNQQDREAADWGTWLKSTATAVRSTIPWP